MNKCHLAAISIYIFTYSLSKSAIFKVIDPALITFRSIPVTCSLGTPHNKILS